MVTRTARGALILALLLGGGGCGDPRAADPLPVGREFPGFARSWAPWEVVWVIRPEDFLTCQTVARGVRAFQRAPGVPVPVTVVYVGDSHADWVRDFLRRQRIQATVRTASERQFADWFGQPAAPRVYLLRRGRVADQVSARDDRVHLARRWGRAVGGGEGRGGG